MTAVLAVVGLTVLAAAGVGLLTTFVTASLVSGDEGLGVLAVGLVAGLLGGLGGLVVGVGHYILGIG